MSQNGKLQSLNAYYIPSHHSQFCLLLYQGTAIRDRIQESLRGQNGRGLLDYSEEDDDEEYYYDSEEEYYDDDGYYDSDEK